MVADSAANALLIVKDADAEECITCSNLLSLSLNVYSNGTGFPSNIHSVKYTIASNKCDTDPLISL